MPETLASTVVPTPADRVWPLVRDFDGLPTWHPAIATSRLGDEDAPDRIGARRTLTMVGGGTVVEELVALDDPRRELSYEIRESPFPVRGYRSTLRVVPVTDRDETFIEWSVVFDCEETEAQRLTAFFRDEVFGTGLRGLRDQLSSS